VKAFIRPFLAMVLAVSITPALAHGDEKHGEQETRPVAAAAASHGEPGHDMATMAEDAASSGVPAGHDTGQVRSEGVMGILKSLHPATVHFPIALFLMAALTELLVLARPTPEREGAVRIMLYGAAAGGLLAALFGWIHTGLWFGGDTAMQVHRWNGMLIAILGVAAAWAAHRRRESRTALRLLLFPVAALLIVQGFLGGELAHGANHLKL
jgi:uncharacterized membrane protein